MQPLTDVSRSLSLQIHQISIKTSQLSASELPKIYSTVAAIFAQINQSSSQMNDFQTRASGALDNLVQATQLNANHLRNSGNAHLDGSSPHNTVNPKDSTSLALINPPIFEPGTGCPLPCGCRCHNGRKRKLESPAFLENIFGSLKVEHRGIPFFTPSCNRQSCRARNTSRFGVSTKFRCPPWLWKASLYLSVANDTYSGPEMVFRVRGRFTLKLNDPVWRACWWGDVAFLKKLFMEGRASPHDESVDNGESLLDVSLFFRQLEREVVGSLFLGSHPELKVGGMSVSSSMWP